MIESDVFEAIAYAEGSWGKPIPKASMEVWFAQIQELDFDVVRRAIDELAASSGFTPTPQMVRERALELVSGRPDFEQVWEELVDAASRCDWFDPNPPADMSLVAQALARSLGWAEFRTIDLTTYYVHEARARFTEITERASRRMREGLPAFESVAPLALPGEVSDLVEQIGEPVQELIPPPADLTANVDDVTRAAFRARQQARGQEDWTPERIEAAKEAGRRRLEDAIGEELAAQEKARAKEAKRVSVEPSGL
jgi:hypothetical protein